MNRALVTRKILGIKITKSRIDAGIAPERERYSIANSMFMASSGHTGSRRLMIQ